MDMYLQPSPVRSLLDATIDFRNTQKRILRPVDYQGAMAVRLGGAVCLGTAQAVYCFAIWVIASAVSLVSLGSNDSIEHFTRRFAALSVGGCVGVMIAGSSIFHGTQVAEVITAKIAARADRQFKDLCESFVSDFDKEAQQLRKARQLAVVRNREVARFDGFDQAVKTMLTARKGLKNRRCKAYPRRSLEKFEALANSRQEMFSMLSEQRAQIKNQPYTQRQLDRDFVERAQILADKVLQALYLYPKVIWAQRIKKWGSKWPRESFAEQCLKLFKKNGVDKEVEALVNHVKEAGGKERAFQRCESEFCVFERKIKGQIDQIERPSVIRRAWWHIEVWFQSI